METCALCGNVSELRQSHILPAFVFKWQKKTAGNTYIRFGENPNKRVQDGLKIDLLCNDCEQLFGQWKTEFSKQIFHPYSLDAALKTKYAEWYSKFCVSVSWRVLTYFMKENAFDDVDFHILEGIRNAEYVWKEFLMGRIKTPNEFEQHVLPCDAIKYVHCNNTPDNINRFLMRGVEMDFVTSGTYAMTYAKLGKIMIFGYVCPPKQRWKGSKISISYGIFEPRKYILPIDLLDFIYDRARNMKSLRDEISDSQQKKINENIMKNPDAFRDSDLFKSMMEDYRLFGEDAIISKLKNEV